MNHVYRIVFNRSLGIYQCVSEIAKSRGKASGKSQTTAKNSLTLKGLVIAMMGLSGSAMAVTYDDGQTHTLYDNPYVVTDDTISGEDTNVNGFDIEVGKQNDGTLNITGKKVQLTVENNLTIGQDATGTVIITRTEDDNDHQPFPENDLRVKQDTILGAATSGSGILKIDGRNNFQTTNLVIGQQGRGEFQVSNTPYHRGLTRATDTTYIGGLGDNSTNATGSLTVEDSSFVSPKLVVGNTGSGTLRLINDGEIEVHSLERNPNSVRSDIYIDGGEIEVSQDQRLCCTIPP